MSNPHCEHLAHGAPAGDDGSQRRDFQLPSEVGGVRIPDSELAKAVTSLVREVSPLPLFNHVVRSFLFGSRLGAAKGLKFDPELLSSPL